MVDLGLQQPEPEPEPARQLPREVAANATRSLGRTQSNSVSYGGLHTHVTSSGSLDLPVDTREKIELLCQRSIDSMMDVQKGTLGPRLRKMETRSRVAQQTLVERFGPVVARQKAMHAVKDWLTVQGMDDCLEEVEKALTTANYPFDDWVRMLDALNDDQLMLLYKEGALRKLRREHRDKKKAGVQQLSNLLSSIKTKSRSNEFEQRTQARKHWRKIQLAFKCGALAKRFVVATQETVEARLNHEREEAEMAEALKLLEKEVEEARAARQAVRKEELEARRAEEEANREVQDVVEAETKVQTLEEKLSELSSTMGVDSRVIERLTEKLNYAKHNLAKEQREAATAKARAEQERAEAALAKKQLAREEEDMNAAHISLRKEKREAELARLVHEGSFAHMLETDLPEHIYRAERAVHAAEMTMAQAEHQCATVAVAVYLVWLLCCCCRHHPHCRRRCHSRCRCQLLLVGVLVFWHSGIVFGACVFV